MKELSAIYVMIYEEVFAGEISREKNSTASLPSDQVPARLWVSELEYTIFTCCAADRLPVVYLTIACLSLSQ